MICEECWARANLKAMGDSSKTVTEYYMELVCDECQEVREGEEE